MAPEAWAFLASEMTTIGTVLVAWIQFRKPVRKLGNGFADRVEQQLKDIKTLALEARDEIREHKSAHVEASLRRINDR